MSFSIPVRMLATAAAAAARIYRENEEDVFDEGDWSRARMIAIAAMRRVFPNASQASIARCFGMMRDAKKIAIACEQSRNAGWWSDDAVFRVYLAVKHLGGYSDDFLPVEAREPRVEIEEERGTVFVPRKVDPSKVRLAPVLRRPANVTAQLLGDPPPGRREFLEKTPHRNYAFIDGKTRSRGSISGRA